MPQKNGQVIFNHGQDSHPWGSKIVRLAEVAQQRGLLAASVDYQGMMDPQARISLLLGSVTLDPRPLILVGSSMGGYVAAAAAPQLQPQGLFLLAPALYMPGYPPLEPAPNEWKTTLVHGWKDEVIPFEHSLRYAHACGAQLHLLNDGHRLLADMELLAGLFDLFLDSVLEAGEGNNQRSTGR